MILEKLWTKEVNIPEFNSSYEYVTELCERLEDFTQAGRGRIREVPEMLQECF